MDPFVCAGCHPDDAWQSFDHFCDACDVPYRLRARALEVWAGLAAV